MRKKRNTKACGVPLWVEHSTVSLRRAFSHLLPPWQLPSQSWGLSRNRVCHPQRPNSFEWMNEGIEEWMSEWVSKWMSKWMSEGRNGGVNEWLSEKVNGWAMNEWRSEWVSEWMNPQLLNYRMRRLCPVFLPPRHTFPFPRFSPSDLSGLQWPRTRPHKRLITTHRFPYARVSQSWHCCHLGQDNPLLKGHCVPCRVFSSIPVLCPPDVSRPSTQLWQCTVSPDVARYPLGATSSLAENHFLCHRLKETPAVTLRTVAL